MWPWQHLISHSFDFSLFFPHYSWARPFSKLNPRPLSSYPLHHFNIPTSLVVIMWCLPLCLNTLHQSASLRRSLSPPFLSWLLLFFSLVSPASEFAISDLPLCSTATITVRSCHSWFSSSSPISHHTVRPSLSLPPVHFCRDSSLCSLVHAVRCWTVMVRSPDFLSSINSLPSSPFFWFLF